MENIVTRTGVFWGSFDPPTLAHKAIMVKMLDLFQEVLIIVNNFTQIKYFTSVEHRMNMLQVMLSDISNQPKILQQNDSHIYDYLKLKQQIPENLSIVVGLDALQTWSETHAITELVNYDAVYIVPRFSSLVLNLKNFTNIFLLPIDLNYQGMSSTQVRANLSITHNNTAKIAIDNNVLTYIKQHKLY